MDATYTRPSPVTSILSLVALGALGAGVVIAELIVAMSAASLAETYPEFASLHAPLLTAAIVFGVCVEAVLLITAFLVVAIARGRMFDRAASRLVDALVVTLIIATVVVASVLPLLPGPPALVLAVFGGVIAGAAVTLVVMALRSLLRQAAFMRLELDEVV